MKNLVSFLLCICLIVGNCTIPALAVEPDNLNISSEAALNGSAVVSVAETAEVSTDTDIIDESVSPAATGADFENHPSYNKPLNPYTVGWNDGSCTRYAWGRTHQVLGISLPGMGDGGSWYINAPAKYSKGQTPKAHSLAVWTGGYRNYGHVAFVESANSTHVTISEGGRTSGGWYREETNTHASIKTRLRDYTFVGYVYLTSTTPADTTKPTISSFAIGAKESHRFSVKVSASDNVGLSKMRILWGRSSSVYYTFKDFTLSGKSISNKEHYIYDISIAELDVNFAYRGEYRIYAEIWDTSGNKTTSGTITYTHVNQNKPFISFTYDGRKYEIYPDILTWEEASKKCNEKGGHLATITSQAEYDAIKAQVNKTPTYNINNVNEAVRKSYYIGGLKNAANEWGWVTGEPFGFQKWSSGYPKTGSNMAWLRGTHTWDDATYNSGRFQTTGYICEYPAVVTGVSLNKTEVVLAEGEALTLLATTVPAAAIAYGGTWSSNNPSVATVDSTGKVAAKALGAAVIAFAPYKSALSASCTVTVANPTPLEGLALNHIRTTLQISEGLILSASAQPKGAKLPADLLWTSSDHSIATVADGVVQAVNVGVSTITVTGSENGNKFTAACTMIVKDNSGGEGDDVGEGSITDGKIKQLWLDRNTHTLNEGAEFRLLPSISPVRVDNRKLDWASDNSNVATVDMYGNVTALSAGDATITARTTDGGNIAAACIVTVKDLAGSSVGYSGYTLKASKSSITLNLNVRGSLQQGDTYLFSVTPKPASVPLGEYENTSLGHEIYLGKIKLENNPLDISIDKGNVRITTNLRTELKKSYKVRLFTDTSKKPTNITVRTVKNSNVAAKPTISIGKSVNLSKPGSAAVLSLKLSNYNGTPLYPDITIMDPSGNDVSHRFAYERVEGKLQWRISQKEGTKLAKGSYSVSLKSDSENGASLPTSNVKRLKVIATKPKLTLSTNRVSLNRNAPYSTQIIEITSKTGYSAVRNVTIRKGGTYFDVIDLGNGKIAVMFKGGANLQKVKSATITVSVFLKGNNGEVAPATTTIKVNVPK